MNYTIDQLAQFVKKTNVSKLAKETGISRSTLVRLSKGDKTITYKSIEKLSNYIDEIFEG